VEKSIITVAIYGLFYQPRMIDEGNGAVSEVDEWQGKPKCSETKCPSTALSTTDPTWLEPGSNLGHRSEKSATSRLSYSTAFTCVRIEHINGDEGLQLGRNSTTRCKVPENVYNWYRRESIPEDSIFEL
jgi:hypothetical protein